MSTLYPPSSYVAPKPWGSDAVAGASHAFFFFFFVPLALGSF